MNSRVERPVISLLYFRRGMNARELQKKCLSSQFETSKVIGVDG